MKLKQAKPISWTNSNDGVVGENGVKANGFSVRSDVKSGLVAEPACTSYVQMTTEKGVTSVRDCVECPNQSATCGDWRIISS